MLSNEHVTIGQVLVGWAQSADGSKKGYQVIEQSKSVNNDDARYILNRFFISPSSLEGFGPEIFQKYNVIIVGSLPSGNLAIAKVMYGGKDTSNRETYMIRAYVLSQDAYKLIGGQPFILAERISEDRPDVVVDQPLPIIVDDLIINRADIKREINDQLRSINISEFSKYADLLWALESNEKIAILLDKDENIDDWLSKLILLLPLVSRAALRLYNYCVSLESIITGTQLLVVPKALSTKTFKIADYARYSLSRGFIKGPNNIRTDIINLQMRVLQHSPEMLDYIKAPISSLHPNELNEYIAWMNFILNNTQYEYAYWFISFTLKHTEYDKIMSTDYFKKALEILISEGFTDNRKLSQTINILDYFVKNVPDAQKPLVGQIINVTEKLSDPQLLNQLYNQFYKLDWAAEINQNIARTTVEITSRTYTTDAIRPFIDAYREGLISEDDLLRILRGAIEKGKIDFLQKTKDALRSERIDYYKLFEKLLDELYDKIITYADYLDPTELRLYMYKLSNIIDQRFSTVEQELVRKCLDAMVKKHVVFIRDDYNTLLRIIHKFIESIPEGEQMNVINRYSSLLRDSDRKRLLRDSIRIRNYDEFIKTIESLIKPVGNPYLHLNNELLSYIDSGILLAEALLDMDAKEFRDYLAKLKWSHSLYRPFAVAFSLASILMLTRYSHNQSLVSSLISKFDALLNVDSMSAIMGPGINAGMKLPSHGKKTSSSISKTLDLSLLMRALWNEFEFVRNESKYNVFSTIVNASTHPRIDYIQQLGQVVEDFAEYMDREKDKKILENQYMYLLVIRHLSVYNKILQELNMLYSRIPQEILNKHLEGKRKKFEEKYGKLINEIEKFREKMQSKLMK